MLRRDLFTTYKLLLTLWKERKMAFNNGALAYDEDEREACEW